VTFSDGDGVLASQARASTLCDLGRFADAVQLMQTVVASQSQDGHAWCLLARAQLGSADFAAALRSAQTGVALSPDDEWPHRLRSIALLNLDRPEEAVIAAAIATRLAPHEWQTHRSHADALTHTGKNPSESIEAAKRAVALAPHEPGAFFSLGAAAAAAGRREQARDAFEQVLMLDPQHSGAHNELARLHLNRRLPTGPKHLAAAVSGFATAVRTDPGGAVARRNLDLILRSFLSRLAYLIFVAAFAANQLHRDSNSIVVRALPVAFLTIPAYFAARFLRRLSPPLRLHVRSVMTGRSLALATAAEGLAVVSLAGTVLATAGARPPLAFVAVVSALIGRLLLAREMHEKTQQGSDKPRRPWISNSVMWFLAGALLLAAAIFLLSVSSAGSGVAGVGVGVACGAAAVYVIRAVRQRR
jgi:Flp pilus assembly protein TadD